MIEVQIGEAASYAAAGVDIDAGDVISSQWEEAACQTYGNRKDEMGQLAVLSAGAFGIRGQDLDIIQGKKGLILHTSVDGVGTKPELAEQASERRAMARSMVVEEEFRDHGGIFIDVAAMVIEDLARDGIEPFGIATLFDTNTLSAEQAQEVVRQLCVGAVSVCRTANLVYVNGETAELGNRVDGYGDFNYNLGGFALGISHRDRILTGEKVQPGDKIVALREYGFRANGMSLVRKVLAAEFGPMWHLEEEDIAGQALRPSTIYTPALVAMFGGYDGEPQAEVHAIAHITGGGIPGKLQRKLAVSGYGAVLDNLYHPPEIMSRVQEWSMKHAAKKLATPDASMYQSLNGGIGMLIITPDEGPVLKTANNYGHEARVVGGIVKDSGIFLESRGTTNHGDWIKFIPRNA